MSLLAVTSVFLVMMEGRITLSPMQAEAASVADRLIWFIFCVDYFSGLWRSENRAAYLKQHIIELAAILPFNALLKGLRVLRLLRVTRAVQTFRVIRLVVYGGRAAAVFKRFLATRHFYLVLIYTTLFILLGTMLVAYFEGISFANALWWAFVTTTTVGYGDIAPTTTAGRCVAAFLMVTGIGFIGILTGTVATFFLSPNDEAKEINPHIAAIIQQLGDFDSLSEEEIETIIEVIRSVSKTRSSPKDDI